jgi:predicted small integral membrane protein
MPIIRASKVVMVAGLALLAFLVTLGNLTDYGTNYAFVQHVLSMDTIFPGSTLRWRAITDPTLHRAAYALIIAAEAATAALFAVAAIRMAARLGAPRAEFRAAFVWVGAGTLVGVGLWFLGFMAIGGEWFAMWQSASWNGQEPAFRYAVIILLIGLWVMLDTDEP